MKERSKESLTKETVPLRMDVEILPGDREQLAHVCSSTCRERT